MVLAPLAALREYALFAIRNVLHNNPANQAFVYVFFHHGAPTATPN